MISTNQRIGRFLLAAAAGFMLIGAPLLADEISLVKGVYTSQKVKKGYDTSTIGAGLRYLITPPKGQDFALFIEGNLGLISYNGTGAPSNETSIDLFAGVRKYLGNITETIQPYAAVYGGYANDFTDDAVTGTHTELSGLIYKGAVGLQVTSHDGFFIDLETLLFTSNLFSTEKSTTGGVNREVTRTDLYVKTTGSFNTTTVGLGLKF